MKPFILLTIVLIMSNLALYSQIQITTAADLEAVNADAASLKENYQLMNDITVENWTPIGKEKNPFLGVFDGNGYTITILSFREDMSPSKDAFSSVSAGLFGLTGKNSIIKNLRVSGKLMYDSGPVTLYMGAVAGNNGGTIRNCVSTTDINAHGGRYTAGRGIGQMLLPALSGSSNSVTVYQNEACGGGIVGLNRGLIENCYSTGNITVSGEGHKTAGGIAGRNGFDKEGNIIQCYATGNILAKEDAASRYAGGIAGSCIAGSVINCVALNEKIETSGKRKGMTVGGYGIGYPSNIAFGVIAYNFQNTDRVKNSYYRNDMIVYMETDQDAEKKNKSGKKNLLYGSRGTEVNYALTQEQNWWSNSKEGVSFPFGKDEKMPWIWNNDLKRPVLYWEINNL